MQLKIIDFPLKPLISDLDRNHDRSSESPFGHSAISGSDEPSRRSFPSRIADGLLRDRTRGRYQELGILQALINEEGRMIAPLFPSLWGFEKNYYE